MNIEDEDGEVLPQIELNENGEPEEAYRISIDVGWRNMCIEIVRIRTKEEILEALEGKDIPDDCFYPLGWACTEPEGRDFNKWTLVDVGGKDTSTYIEGAAKVLSKQSAVRLGIIKRVRIEMQNVHKNPVAWGIEQGLKGIFAAIKATSPYGWPVEVSVISPVKKFGYFGLVCPEGEEAKVDRKQLSVDLVVSILERQSTLGLIPQRWPRIICNTKKKDDFADAFLQDYTEEALSIWGKPRFEACCRIIRVIMQKKYYSRGNIRINAAFEKAVIRYEKQASKPPPAASRKQPRAPTRKRNKTVQDGYQQTKLIPIQATTLETPASFVDEDDIFTSTSVIVHTTISDASNSVSQKPTAAAHVDEDEDEYDAAAAAAGNMNGRKKRKPKVTMKRFGQIANDVKARGKQSGKASSLSSASITIDITEDEEASRYNGGPLADEDDAASSYFIDPSALPAEIFQSTGYIPVSQLPSWQVE